MPQTEVRRNTERREYEWPEIVELPGIGTSRAITLSSVAGDSFEEVANASAVDILQINGLGERTVLEMKRWLENFLDIEEAFTDTHVLVQWSDSDALPGVSVPSRPSPPFFCEVSNGVLRLPVDTNNSPKLIAKEDAPETFAKVDTPYNPNVDTTALDEFLEAALAQEDQRDTLMEIVGSCLVPYDSQRVAVLYGPGNSGKTTFQNAIYEMIGDRYSVMTWKQFTRTSWLESLDVSQANIGSHIGEPWENPGEIMSQLLSEYDGNPFAVSVSEELSANTAQMIFTTNHTPVPPTELVSMPEKWVPVEFPYVFENDPGESPYRKQRDVDMIRSFGEDETVQQSLLVKAAEGVGRLLENGDVSLSMAPQERVEEYSRIRDADYDWYHDPHESFYLSLQ